MNHRFFLAILLLSACQALSPVESIDTRIGTGFHGHTYPGATTPYGMVQLSPDTRVGGWDAAAGYHYSDDSIIGFSHTHLNGTGCLDLGDILFYPSLRQDLIQSGQFRPTPYAFSHKNEIAKPGYYSVDLKSDGIKVELTALPHTGVHRYTFKGKGERKVAINLIHSVEPVPVDLHSFECVGTNTISGMRRTQGWSLGREVYFDAIFSEPFTNVELVEDSYAVISFSENVKQLTIAVGISAISTANAKLNRSTELETLDFDAAHQASVALWEDALSDIQVSGAPAKDIKTFNSALYRSKLTPNLMSDVNGQFRRQDGSIATLPEGQKYYSTLSLWDTYRAWNPLQTVIDHKLVSDVVASIIDMGEAKGVMPLWPLWSNETHCMIGYHSAPVLADAYINGIAKFDTQKVLPLLVYSSNNNKKGSDYYSNLGYIPANRLAESVSCSLEYSYDDWTIARLAEACGDKDNSNLYYQRALNYHKLYDGAVGFFHGLNDDGSFSTAFDQFAASRDLTEANPWQYRFGVQHDIEGLIQLFGGREQFIEALDGLFSTEMPAGSALLSDITGLIGQYAHGNEPSHHMAYLYNYAGQPWKTQAMTRRILNEQYSPTPEGISGNEDCGQMSAWYVLTSLGLYSVTPASGQFNLTTPLFADATVKLGNGKTLHITANDPARNAYISSVTLNDVEIERNYLTFDELMQGGELVFTLQAEPDYERGTSVEAAPYSLTQGAQVSAPYTTSKIKLFQEQIDLNLHCNTAGATIHYSIDGGAEKIYTEPIHLENSAVIRAYATKEGANPSIEVVIKPEKASFYKAHKLSNPRSGVHYQYYQGVFARVSEISSGVLAEEGEMPEPTIENAPDEDHYGYIFTGYFLAPETGIYEFYTISDDGSALWVEDRLVVSNDGSHSAIISQGLVALEAGYHPFTLKYFEDYEGQAFHWGVLTPTAPSKCPMPAEMLFVQ